MTHREAHKYLKEYFNIQDIHFAETANERIYLSNVLAKEKSQAVYDCGEFSRKEVKLVNICADLAWEKVNPAKIKQDLFEDNEFEEAVRIVPTFFICGYEGYGIKLNNTIFTA